MTVTLQEAVISGCCVTEAVIVALPFFTAVTTPFLLTFATEVSLLFHVTVASVIETGLIHGTADSGIGTTFRVYFCPRLILTDLLLREIP